MKRAEGIVEILEAFDLTGCYRSAAAELAGCSHHTVARYVRLRASGRVLTERAMRDRLIDGFLGKVDASMHTVVERIVRSELIVVDDIGLLPVGADEAEALYRLVDAAYERRSLILTSNLHPARFDSNCPKGIATAVVDRLLHHAHVIVTEGRSHRLAQALDGRGVRRLDAPDA